MLLAASGTRSLADAILPRAGVSRLAAQAGLAVFGTLLLVASSKVQVPMVPVPMSLTTMVVPLIAGFYGLRLGLATVLLYILEGALGLPVFSGTPEKGIGLPYMLGPTGGYIAGYVLATIAVGLAADRGWHRSIPAMLGAVALGDALIIGTGFLWLSTLIGPDKALAAGVVPFLLGDAIKVVLAALLICAGSRGTAPPRLDA